MNRHKADLALGLNTLIWGATFTIVKTALRDISPVLFLALRFSLATVALGGLWLARWRKARGESQGATGGVLAGTFLFAGFLLQTLGLQFTSPPKSAFLTGLASVMVPMLAALVYQNRPQALEVLGVLVATAGLGLMTLQGPIGSMEKGDVLTLFCAAAFAGHIVILGHYSEKTAFEVLSVTQVATAALLAVGLSGWVKPSRAEWRPAVIYAILVTGLLATALTFTVQAWAQRYTTSTRTALIYTLEPVFAWLISFWFLGTGLAVRAAAGAALILGGVVLVEMKPLRNRVHP